MATIQVKFFSSWFCPYAQRAWLTLEHHNIPFEYVESLTVNKNQEEGIHGYTKHPRLLQLNPKGLVPTLDVSSELVRALDEPTQSMLCRNDEIDAWIMTESIDCMVFLNQVAMAQCGDTRSPTTDIIPQSSSSTLVEDANFFNQTICSTFYKILMKPTREEQKEAFVFFAASIDQFVQKVQPDGFYNSETPTIVDFTVIPWLLRIPLLQHYRPMLALDHHLNAKELIKLNEYLSRVRGLDAVQKTLWENECDLIQVYERYADGSAKSQVGQAVSSGKNAHDV